MLEIAYFFSFLILFSGDIMENKLSKEEVISLLIPLVGGFLSGLISMGGMKEFNSLTKPFLAPPGFIFPIVWTILYVLMGIGSYLIYKESDYRSSCCLKIYAINLFPLLLILV